MLANCNVPEDNLWLLENRSRDGRTRFKRTSPISNEISDENLDNSYNLIFK